MGLTGGNLMRAVTHGDDFQTDPGYAASMQADAACGGGGEVYQQVTFTLHGIGRVLWAAVMERWGLMYSPEDVFRRRALPPYQEA